MGVTGRLGSRAPPDAREGADAKEDVVGMALEDGADVHAKDSHGWTPLMRAGTGSSLGVHSIPSLPRAAMEPLTATLPSLPQCCWARACAC